MAEDKEAVRAALKRAGATVQDGGSVDVSDPWGNHVQVVDYREIQFSRTAAVLRAMRLDGLEKTDGALAELRERGLLD